MLEAEKAASAYLLGHLGIFLATFVLTKVNVLFGRHGIFLAESVASKAGVF